MSQTQLIRGVATSIRFEEETDDTVIRYHSTDVVRFNADRIILDSGGKQTITTKLRMNQAANQFGLGFQVFQVFQVRRKWFVSVGEVILDFVNGMEIKRGNHHHRHQVEEKTDASS